MRKITNKTDGPIQLVVKSKKQARAFTTLIVPGRGRNKNVVIIEDEVKTDYIDRLADKKLISIEIV